MYTSSRRKRARLAPDPERALLPAVEKLTGLNPDRVNTARETIRALNIPHLNRELLHPTIDAAVGATLLADSLDRLTELGIEHSKLASKLRNDRDVWPTWAELRAARDLCQFLEDDAEIQLEAGRSRGKHSDFRFRRENGPIFRFLPSEGASSLSVEFKALGLSDDEADFCRRATPTLEALRPAGGFVTVHTQLDFDMKGIWMDDAARAHGEREAIRLASQLPAHTQGLSGAVVVGHGSEESYIRRLTSDGQKSAPDRSSHSRLLVRGSPRTGADSR